MQYLCFQKLWVLQYGVIVSLVFDLVSGLSGLHGPKYKTTAKYCVSSSECSTSKQEVCWWLYDGCSKGQCMCDPRRRVADHNGHCKPMRIGGEACARQTRCLEGMVCRRGTCHCAKGTMTPDRRFCLQPHQKLLGQSCSPNKHRCVHRASYGYTDSEVLCSSKGKCQCQDGYKADGISCRKWNIGEFGCTRSYHCDGGALCRDGRCECPPDYLIAASNRKCAKRGAIFDLPIGASCDEVNEKRYCAEELVCHQCGQERDYKCVKFLISEEEINIFPNAASSITATCIIIISSLSAILIYSSR